MTPRPRREDSRANERRRTRGIDSYRCRVCRGIHPLKRCGRFLKLSAEKRLRAVLINKYCSNCLAHQHSGGSCRSGDKCRICQEDHHTLLHMRNGRRSPSQAPRSVSPVQRQRPQSTPRVQPPSLATLLQHRNPQVLPTASILIHNGSTEYDTRALIDPCEAVSRINASLAKAFHLNSVSIGAEEACTAVIRSLTTPDFELEVILKVDPDLHMRTPSSPIDGRIRQKFGHITLADENFDRPATVAIVLGADVYADIVRTGVLPNTEGLPVAQHTVFGWTLSGSCRAL